MAYPVLAEVHPASTLIGHVYLDPDGRLAVTPAAGEAEIDQALLAVASRRIVQWLSSSDRRMLRSKTKRTVARS